MTIDTNFKMFLIELKWNIAVYILLNIIDITLYTFKMCKVLVWYIYMLQCDSCNRVS